MKTAMIVLMLLISLTITGCALLNKVAPSQVDANGVPIPGTHTATATANTVAGLAPWGIGSVALNAILLVVNGIEKYNADKVGKGLTATLQALNKVKDDPTLKAQ